MSVGASREVIEHVLKQHPCRDREAEALRRTDLPTARIATCPCDGAMVAVCSECDSVLFVTAEPGAPWCAHARELADHGALITEVIGP